MLRRHGIGLRTLLMLADGALAVVLLGLLSIIRFGIEWLSHWQPMLQEPLAFAFAYAVLWVGVLWLHGLYRPRSRWTLRSEGLAIARATVVMALITLSILFVFKLPDVSRSFLTVPLPDPVARHLASRAALRVASSGSAARSQSAVRPHDRRRPAVPGFRGEAHRPSRARSHDQGLPRRRAADLPPGWRYLGPLSAIESLLHSEVIDEVVICLPVSQWDRINAIAQLCEEEGKIVRLPVDFLEHAFAMGRIEELDGTPVYSLVSGPDRVTALLVKRVFDLVVATVGLVMLSPVLLAFVPGDPRPRRQPDPLPPDARRPPRSAVRRPEVPDHGRRR